MKRKAVEVERSRWSAKAKREVVLRLLRGEDLDEEVTRLKETLGEMTLRCELQADAIRRLKAGLPLDPRRSGS